VARRVATAEDRVFAAIHRVMANLALDSLVIDSGFAMWGIGLLALIGFGFYMRVRHVRFR
jgi:hypothetical protein